MTVAGVIRYTFSILMITSTLIVVPAMLAVLFKSILLFFIIASAIDQFWLYVVVAIVIRLLYDWLENLRS